MEKEFVPYIEAFELKELGFDKPCFVYWVFNNVEITFSTTDNRSGWSMIGFTNSQMSKKAGLCTAPIYSQAFRFFREKHGLHSEIRYVDDVLTYSYLITKIKTNTELEEKFRFTYEEAELACLRKLIEIVKTKQ